MPENTVVALDEDKRWRLVNVTMRRHGYKPHALIETLHTIQEAFGFLDEAALRYVAQNLRIPLSRVYGVATFYNHFALKPKGEHVCVVCMGTACYIKGGSAISDGLQTAFEIKPGATTPDNKMSLMIAHCVGMCWLAPVALFDDQVLSELTPETAIEKVKEQISNVS
jgi:bidirectional [NiFe] hydrogenase diaphorase subunit